MGSRGGFESRARMPALVLVLLLALGVTGCASGPAPAQRVSTDVATATAVPAVGVYGPGLPPGVEAPQLPPVGERLLAKMADYDGMYVRIGNTDRVAETYGIDVTFPAQAAGGKLAGMWMQVPDVDGGFAWALYDTNLTEIQVWIAPSLAYAKHRVGEIGRYATGGEYEVLVNGRPGVAVPRVWMPSQRIRSIAPRGSGYTSARWSDAVVEWSFGQCVVRVSSTERDVEELLVVANAVSITGEARMPKPTKK